MNGLWCYIRMSGEETKQISFGGNNVKERIPFVVCGTMEPMQMIFSARTELVWLIWDKPDNGLYSSLVVLLPTEYVQ